MAKTKFKFECFKKGHVPMPNLPEEIMVLNGFLHMGRVCQMCRCAYFEQLSDEQVEKSGLVNAAGKEYVV